MRQIPAVKRQGKSYGGAAGRRMLESFIERSRASIERATGTKFDWTISDFEAWYQTHMPVPASYLDLQVNDTGPNVNGTYLKKMSAADSDARDPAVLDRISEAFEKHDTVLVVFGATHFVYQRPAIKDVMGEPTVSKSF